jgi:putative Mn2+ efflux pump MntP
MHLTFSTMVGMPSLTQHLDALLLALASSTDNFTVGLSVGICRKDLSVWANVVISVCNATGALIAGYGGVVLSQRMPLLAPLLAATAFAYLAVQEFVAYYRQSYKKDAKKDEAPIHLVRLALPMTLNNLAGGVAGGAAGLSPLISALYALLASFGTMAVGYAIGRRLGRTSLPVDPSLLAGILLGALCLVTIQEILSHS